MIQVATYSVADVFSAMDAPRRSKSKPVLPDSRPFKRTSGRLVLFKAKGTVCVTCGIEGTLFVLETQNVDITPHLNLYAINADGDRVLMTKDHILPKSKGGPNTIENYATMCSPCNAKKADTLTVSS